MKIFVPITNVEIVALVLKKLAFCWSDCNVGDGFEVRRASIFKYTRLVCKALANKDKLYSRYINIPNEAKS